MKDDPLFDEIERYCAATGLKPSTVCVRAVNDSRYLHRHLRRLEVLERDREKIRRYMAENPPPREAAE